MWPEYAATLDWSSGAVENGQASLGGPPWSDVEGYAAASPYLQADRITAPLLLITADRDYVPMANAQRMMVAMHRQGKWARLATYWGDAFPRQSGEYPGRLPGDLRLARPDARRGGRHTPDRRCSHARTQPSIAAVVMMST